VQRARLKTPKVMTEWPLRYYVAEQTVVFVQTPLARVKVCRIMFGSDGSIYVDFPYLPTKRGILSEIEFPNGIGGKHQRDLRQNGVHVTTDVKFSHHPTGVVHFSKAGHAGPFPERQSFGLAEGMGLVFEAHVFWLPGLRELEALKQRDLHIGFRFEGADVNSAVVRAEWRRKSDIVANRDDETGTLGPDTTAMRRETGVVSKFRLLGQPKHLPLQDHLLLLAAEPIDLAEGASDPGIVFLGGWNEHERTPEFPDRHLHTCLSFMYPCEPKST
jgi:hypothetical protein